MNNDPLTRDEMALLDDLALESIEPVAPPHPLRARILAAVRETPQNSRTVRADEGRWMSLPSSGVSIKLLSTDEKRGTATILMSLDPGSRIAAHDHRGDEETFVVSGSCRIGAVGLSKGDFHRAEAGSHHGDVVSDEGCVLLLVVDQDDYRAA
jgi:anti-sigma factor ChrR (cupin superfamily)